MKSICITLGLCLSCMLATAQGRGAKLRIKYSKYIKMTKFNIGKFNQSNDGGLYVFQLEDSSQVVQMETPDLYAETVTMSDGVTEIRKSYYRPSGNVRSEATYFHGFPIGTTKRYSEQGAVTEQIDEDQPYLFSINDLNVKMTAMGIDIMHGSSGVIVSRTDKPSPIYQVFCPVNGMIQVSRVLVIDGTTGAVLSDAEHSNGY